MKKIILEISEKKIPICIGEGLLQSFNPSKYVKNKDVLIIGPGNSIVKTK